MLKKSYARDKGSVKVTFNLEPEEEAKTANLVGEFNAWDLESLPMKRRRDGGFSLTVELESDNEYRFRYLLDGSTWMNDMAADEYVPNPYGSDDSVVRV